MHTGRLRTVAPHRQHIKSLTMNNEAAPPRFCEEFVQEIWRFVNKRRGGSKAKKGSQLDIDGQLFPRFNEGGGFRGCAAGRLPRSSCLTNPRYPTISGAKNCCSHATLRCGSKK
jgi:hypothetical protein